MSDGPSASPPVVWYRDGAPGSSTGAAQPSGRISSRARGRTLRTPLTLLVGLSESLVRAKPALPPAQHDTAIVLHEEGEGEAEVNV